MLILKNIGKDYASGRSTGHALRCVNLVLRSRELVMVLGPTGSGKTTLLNILGAQEPFSRGEMLIHGTSVRKFTDKQWSHYRRCVGFMDPGRLLPDRTLAENARLGLLVSGEKRGVSRQHALDMLKLVGLEKAAGRCPGELSAGQRKLAALACALASDPDVLLADEPTQGLDAVWGRRVAGLLRETARDRLVITASRKPLFPEGEVRTLRLKEGTLESDSAPCGEKDADRGSAVSRRGLPFGRVFGMALENLRRKKTKTAARVLTGLCAGLCAGLLLVLTGAVSEHSAQLQQNTLSAYPILLTEEDVPSGDLAAVAQWLRQSELPTGTEAQYGYAVTPWIFDSDTSAVARQVNPTGDGADLWTQLPTSSSMRQARYDLVSGRWPERHDEVVIIQNAHGGYSQAGLLAMGIQPDAETGELIPPGYDSLLHRTFRLVLPVDAYYPNVDGTWGNMTGDADYMRTVTANALSVKVVGILRPASNTADTSGDVFVGYTAAMTDHIVDSILTSPLVTGQQADPGTDILTGLPFDTQGRRTMPQGEKAGEMLAYALALQPEQMRFLYQEITGKGVAEDQAAAALEEMITSLSAEEAAALYDRYIGSQYSPSSYAENMQAFGAADAQHLTAVRLYASSLADRETLSGLLDTYEEPLRYTDETETMVASFRGFTDGLERLLPVLCWVVLAGFGATVVFVTGGSVAGRHRDIALLRSLGMPRGALTRIYGWEGLLLGLVPGGVGVLLSGVLSGLVCRLAGWSEIVSFCRLSVGGALLTVAVCALAALAAGILAAAAEAGDAPAEILRRD